MTQAKPLCGFLNVLKPPGMSSAQVVGCVRRLLGGVKAGHAGPGGSGRTAGHGGKGCAPV